MKTSQDGFGVWQLTESDFNSEQERSTRVAWIAPSGSGMAVWHFPIKMSF